MTEPSSTETSKDPGYEPAKIISFSSAKAAKTQLRGKDTTAGKPIPTDDEYPVTGEIPGGPVPGYVYFDTAETTGSDLSHRLATIVGEVEKNRQAILLCDQARSPLCHIVIGIIGSLDAIGKIRIDPKLRPILLDYTK